MIYSLLRVAAGVALRWYYADVTIVGDGAQHSDGPLLVTVNHPNALVDVLVAGRAVPRRLLFTAKATLFSNPVSSALLGWIGVIPLRRASDESGGADPSRNAEAFRAITGALAAGGAILIFPEGRSHDEPAIAPLRTGTARIALTARDSGTVKGLRILPVGLVFERKERARTRVLAVVGKALDIDGWPGGDSANAIAELTAEIDARLRDVTLNYDTSEDAITDLRIATQVAALVRYDAPSVGDPGDLRDRTTIARFLPAVRVAARAGSADIRSRATAFESALAELQQSLDSRGVSLDDLTISRGVTEGAVFAVRELAVLLTAGPIAVWGWINHLLPFRLAIMVGRRTRESAADPAMRTILAGTAFVLAIYMLQGAGVALLAGPWWAIAYVVSLPIAADINLRFGDRLDRASRRARTYFLFREDPDFHDGLALTARALRAEALALAALAGVYRDG